MTPKDHNQLLLITMAGTPKAAGAAGGAAGNAGNVGNDSVVRIPREPFRAVQGADGWSLHTGVGKYHSPGWRAPQAPSREVDGYGYDIIGTGHFQAI